MPEKYERLVRCFASVFPMLARDQVPTASVHSVPAWDSLRTVTLVAVLEQEFGLDIGVADFEDLDSFEAVRKYLSERRIDL